MQEQINLMIKEYTIYVHKVFLISPLPFKKTFKIVLEEYAYASERIYVMRNVMSRKYGIVYLFRDI